MPDNKQITPEQSKDCSNCKFSKEVAPYKVLLECELDMEVYTQPHVCNRWTVIPISPVKEEK